MEWLSRNTLALFKYVKTQLSHLVENLVAPVWLIPTQSHPIRPPFPIRRPVELYIGGFETQAKFPRTNKKINKPK